MKKLIKMRHILSLLASLTCSITAHAQTSITENFNGTSTSAPSPWSAYGGACLTAATYSASASSTLIPGCTNLPYYTNLNSKLVGGQTGTLPDAIGQGALRLTNGDTTSNGSNGANQTGAIVYTAPFATNQGIQISFNTVTYGGNAYGNSNNVQSGADGITFFLTDASVTPFKLGAYGGALGYSCSVNKSPSDGMTGAYIGLGIDEYGNFANASDNGNASDPKSLGSSPNTISIRGSGNITQAMLNALYPSAAGPTNTVGAICAAGYYTNSPVTTTTTTGSGRHTTTTTTTTYTSTPLQDYPLIVSSVLPGSIAISNQEAVATPQRSKAIPITYSLSITSNGLLSLSYIYNNGISTPVITNQSIITSNGPLPSNFLFGFSAGTGGGTNIHEITCFKAGQISVAASSAAGNANPDSKIQGNSQIFLSSYNASNWTGSLTSTGLTANANGTISIASTPNWDASCVLTGGTCNSTGGTNTAQTSANRTILSWSGSAGIPFEWTSLTGSQQTTLDPTASAASSSSSTRLNFLRGDRTQEITTTGSGTYRARTSVLGDIMNSSPAWVGPPEFPYAVIWKDSLYPNTTMPEAGSASYAQFQTNNQTRLNVVYAGANDGMLHGFRTGSYTATGSISTTNADGLEVLAYVPGLAQSTIHSSTASFDYSSPQYAHNAFVDATPGTGDLFYNGAWHTWLTGGLGAGGNTGGVVGNTTTATVGGIYALDVTTPGNFSETNAASLVIGDWNTNTITCVGNSSCGTHLGSTYGTPIIRRLHDGNWAVIFGNGLNSSAGTAGIFIMVVNSSTGKTSFYYLDTGSGATTNGGKNGIAYVTSADLDGDHITDYIYAGDILGNLWRFDLTSNTESKWAASSTPLFTTPSSSTAQQPISTLVKVNSVISSSTPRVVIVFATGRQFPQTLSSGTAFASGTQSIYGIWDWNMSAWNALNSTQYAQLTAPQSGSTSVSNLTTQILTGTTTTINGSTINAYSGSQNTVCWVGSSSCATGTNTKYGWTVNLPTSTEQVIYNPSVISGILVINSTIPAIPQTLSCTTTPATGYSIGLNISNGGTAGIYGNSTLAGLGLGATGTTFFAIGATGLTSAINQTSSTNPVATLLSLPNTGGTGSRLTWLQLR